MQSTALPLVEQAPQAVSYPFREVVERYKRPVYRLAFDLTGNHHDAEDLSQEVFIKAYRAQESFRGEAQLFSWLYRITVNTYLNKRRKKALRFRQLLDDFSHVAQGDDGPSGPEQHTEGRVLQRHVEQALTRLSPQERSAFVLRHYHDLSVREVAGSLEVAEGTVKSLLFRAARKLQTALAFYRDDLEA